ncbi:mechanosensitive ion channel domain-containing protein [Nitrospirillum sp. BR 11828]|uniref:mechanosensitive ion channel domain-containing protein n=1 Tax=Nitrospirillum sp. BR 11828 TaxID=3104325 RepID=UPI002ACAB6C8|nr:mechanosensitive ion channel domain-containing protein [Nitrospirillum sp. BR 11828]MDZ5646712.1 mechanosensitive ion channel [Nitrospirillum sp. BR 11828]
MASLPPSLLSRGAGAQTSEAPAANAATPDHATADRAAPVPPSDGVTPDAPSPHEATPPAEPPQEAPRETPREHAPVPAHAAGAVSPIAASQAAALLQTLQDPQRRDALIAQLSLLAATNPPAPAAAPPPAAVPSVPSAAPSATPAAPAGASQPAEESEVETLGTRMLDALSDRIEELSEEIAAAGQALLDLPKAYRWLDRQISDPRLREQWGILIGEVLLVVIAGYVARLATFWALSRPRHVLERRQSSNLWVRMGLLLARTLLDAVPMVTFAVAAYGVQTLTHPPKPAAMAALGIILSSLLVQGTTLAARFLLSPGAPFLRLLPVGDETAHYVYIWVRRIALTAVYGYFVAQVAYQLGLPTRPYMALLKVVGLIVGIMLVILVLQNRQNVADWIRGREPLKPEDLHEDGALEAQLAAEISGDAPLVAAPPAPSAWGLVRRRLAEIWHILAIVYLVAIYGIWALEVKGGFGFVSRATLVSVVTIIVARLLMEGADRLIRRGFSIPDDLKRQYPLLESRANRYLPILHRGAKVVVWIVAVLTLLQAWGVDSFGWLSTPFGQRVSSSLLTIVLMVVFALIVWELISGAIERYLNTTDRHGRLVERSPRIRTLLPLVRNVVLVMLLVMVGLTVLAEIGVNIAPLLAGVGFLGVAVGFGSQSLVKDVITGLFILFEDTISVGDSVTLAGYTGTVEGLTIRTIRLRDDSGAVHTVPFSAVTGISNLTKDYSYFTADFGIAYATDLDRAMQIMTEIGEELQNDSLFGSGILAPMEILGVSEFAEKAVKIKFRIKTRPRRQYAVGREFNRRLKLRFDKEGIPFPA